MTKNDSMLNLLAGVACCVFWLAAGAALAALGVFFWGLSTVLLSMAMQNAGVPPLVSFAVAGAIMGYPLAELRERYGERNRP